MCWSWEVSLVTATLVSATVPYLAFRNLHNDRAYAVFLAVFGSMQFIDLALWTMHAQEDLSNCSASNRLVTMFACFVITMEPFAALACRCVSKKEMPSKLEWVWYTTGLLLTIFPMFEVAFRQNGECGGPGYGQSCSHVTKQGHLMYSPGIGPYVDGVWQKERTHFRCWREYVLFGTHIEEIPLPLRVMYLTSMCYPMLGMTPFLSGCLQSVILIATWLVGYFSDAHASMWCLANVVQIITMLADPYIFDSKRATANPVKRGKRELITEDRYLHAKVPQNLDAVVVGSGLGGLTTASLLAKAGKRVLVLEQHYRAGGCTHVFTELGNLFDSGIHYVGCPKTLSQLLGHVADKPIPLAPMGTAEDNYTYDEFELGRDCTVKYSKGIKGIENALIEAFPHEKEGIRAYLKHVEKAGTCTRVFVLLKCLPRRLLPFVPSFIKKFMDSMISPTADDVIGRFVKDKKLKALLGAGQLIDWNLQPNKVSWWVVASMMRYYQHGGYYPRGGSDAIAANIIPAIEKRGGRVLCRAKVDTILIDPTTNAAVGVRLHNGDEIRAKIVISGVGAAVTYEKLLPPAALERAGLQPKLPCVGPSNSHITAFVSLDAPPERFGLRGANIHSMPDLDKFDCDVNAMQEAFYKSPFESGECLMTITCPAAKDPDYQLRFPGKSNVLMLIEAKYEWFRDFEADGYGNRSAAYKEFKQRFEGMFLSRLHRLYPETQGHVESIELGTPLTNRHFLGSPNGESYGLEWVPRRFDSVLMGEYLHPTTHVPKLYLTGEASLFGGMAGACLSGYVTALHVLGLPSFLCTVASSVNVHEC